MSKARESLVFVYGTLRHNELNHAFLRGATPISLQARVQGSLLDTGLGYPAMTYGDEWVFGELYAVNHEQLRQLDALEGYRGKEYENHYDRVQQTVYTDNGVYEAWVYTYSRARAEGLEPVFLGDWKLHRHHHKPTLSYFAFGSVMDNRRLIADGVEHLFEDVLGLGILRGYQLRFTLNRSDGGRADVVEGCGAVEGKIYRINQEALQYLLRREGAHVRIYRPTFVDVEVGGERVQDVLTFTVVDKQPETAPPDWYVEEIVRGGQGFLTDKYLQELTDRLANEFGLGVYRNGEGKVLRS